MTLHFDPEQVARAFGEEPPPDAPAPGDYSAAPREWSAAETKRRLTFVTAAELAARTSEAPPWLLSGYLARGAVTELVGKVKAAGKTTLVLGMVRAILTGELFAGIATEQASVIYLTEQGDVSFRQALQRADLLDADALAVLPRHDAIGVPWPDVVRQAVAEAKVRGAGVLVVDTLPQWAGIHGDGENSAGDALAAITPLQEAASVGNLAVIVVRHSRKGGGDVGDDGRGSSAFTGAVDVVLSVRRPEGTAEPSVRVIHALSRFSETPETLALQLTPDGYVSLGNEAALAIETAKREVLEVAPRDPALAKTGDELIEAAKLRRTSGQEAIRALFEVGALQRTGVGKRGSPFAYWAPNHSAATTTLGAAESIRVVAKVVPDREREIDPMLRAAAETFGESEP